MGVPYMVYSVITGLKAFLQHVSGSTVPRKRSIRVDFMEEPNGSITAHTCANVIVLPRGCCPDYPVFKSALIACMDSCVSTLCKYAFFILSYMYVAVLHSYFVPFMTHIMDSY